MSESQGPEAQQGEEAGEGTVNDPLTRADVDAPRVPFGSDRSGGEAEED